MTMVSGFSEVIDRRANRFHAVIIRGTKVADGVSRVDWTKTTFDDLGRPDVAEAPDGTRAKTIYNGRETTAIRNFEGTDTVNPHANDQIAKTLLNAKGDKQTVTSYNHAGQPLVLSYRYDGVGNLLETEDPDGKIISMSYDIRRA